MSKTSVFTTITPLPPGITRQSVIETYHNHLEMIDLNPLVIDRFQCKPPGYATAEEFHAIWYTIKDKVSYLPGGLVTGSVSYHACFHNLPDALQTHIYAPLGLDIKAKWTVGGSLPGEPKEPAELGLGIPKEGLYLREDVKMKCNIMLSSFVKKTFKESHSKLVDRLVEKAHLLEAKAANERLSFTPQLGSAELASGHQGSNYAQNAHVSMYSASSSSPLQSPSLPQSSPSGLQHQRTSSYQHPEPTYQAYNPNTNDPRLSFVPGQQPNSRYSQYGQNSRPGNVHVAEQQQPSPPAELSSDGPLGLEKKGKGKQGFAAELPG